jgi:hypothetical protein
MSTSDSSVQNIDINKEAERFLNELRLNTVLRELNPQQRKEYYSIVNRGNQQDIDEYIDINIPDLDNKLSQRVRELLLKK